MGIRNEMDDGADLNLILSRRLGVQGAPASNVASEVFPNLTLENDRPEWGYIKREKHCAAAKNQAGGVALAHTGIVNLPGGTGVLGVLQRITVHNPTLLAVTYNVFHNTLQSLGGAFTTTEGHPIDSRWGEQGPTLRAFRGDSAAVPFTIAELLVPALQSVTYDVPLVLGPGSIAGVAAQVIGDRCDASFYWTERAATEGELLGAATF